MPVKSFITLAPGENKKGREKTNSFEEFRNINSYLHVQFQSVISQLASAFYRI